MPLYLGVMSGTSLDGIDVAAVEFEGCDERPDAARLVAFSSRPYDGALRDRLRAACRGGTPAELCALDFDLGRRLAEAVVRALAEARIDPGEVAAIGSHGQTVWHDPPATGGAVGRSASASGPGARDGGAGTDAELGAGAGPDRRPSGGSTLQIGEPAVVAEETGIPVVADFRVRDVAAGGQGAPLTAYFDLLLLSSEERSRAIQNLGGMGNVTALPGPAGGTPLAFDTGPGVALLDRAVERLTGGEAHFDADGRIAAAGSVSERALAGWLEDPFFRTPPPRSTGRERFGDPRLEAWLSRHGDLSPADAVATLTELTARSVEAALEWIPFEVDEAYLCGGGARNSELRRRIEARLAPRPVRPLEALGWDGDAREAAAFALLARQHELGIAAGPAWATGARGPRILGKRVPA